MCVCVIAFGLLVVWAGYLIVCTVVIWFLCLVLFINFNVVCFYLCFDLRVGLRVLLQGSLHWFWCKVVSGFVRVLGTDYRMGLLWMFAVCVCLG